MWSDQVMWSQRFDTSLDKIFQTTVFVKQASEPQCQTSHLCTTTICLLVFKPSLCSVFNFKCHTCWRECELLPSLYVERGEGLESGLARKKLKAALRVLDASHTEEPHEEVKAIHEKCTEHRSLWKETPQWWPKCWIDIFYSALSWKHTVTWAMEAFSRWALEPQAIAMLS